MRNIRIQGVATILIAAVILVVPTTIAGQAGSAAPEQPAEKRFKNIKVLTGIPGSQVMPLMHFMRSY